MRGDIMAVAGAPPPPRGADCQPYMAGTEGRGSGGSLAGGAEAGEARRGGREGPPAASGSAAALG